MTDPYQATPPPDDGVPMPAMLGRDVRLRRISTRDYDYLLALESTMPAAITYRQRGSTPSPDAFVHNLWNGVLCQFVVESVADDRPIGHVYAYFADHRNGHVKVGAIFDPELRGAGWPMEGLQLFFGYLFVVFPLRKLYLETAEFNLGRFRSGALGLFEVEGRLRAHEFHGDRYWDLITLALYRETWTEFERSGSVLDAIAAQSGAFGRLLASPSPAERPEFLAALREGLGLDKEPEPEDDLRVDLGMDSLNIYEIYCFLQDAAGFDVPAALIEELRTVDDVYATYVGYRHVTEQ